MSEIKPLGNAVGHRQELALEAADGQHLVVGYRPQLGAVEHSCLVEATPHHAHREGRAIDRELGTPKRMRQRPNVVLMAVGGDTPDDLVALVVEVAESRAAPSLAPGMESSGKSCPQSSSRSSSSHSMAAQLRPMSPSPPRKVTKLGEP